MKKTITILISLIMVVTVFVACSKIAYDEKQTSQSITQTQTNNLNELQPSKQNTYSDYVIMSFHAVEGAVIYDQSYDSNGYLESCHYHCQCEACGYVSNTNGQARGNLNTSYHCTECGNNQNVEITVDQQWVDVSY